MLDRSTDADGHVELRPDRHPRLADLQHLWHPAAIDGLARGRDRTAEQVRELLEHHEVPRVPEAVASAHDDLGFLRAETALLRELLKVDEGRVDIRRPELDLLRDDLAVQAVADGVLREVVDPVSQQHPGQGRRPQVREAPTFADELHADVSQSLLPVLEEHPHPAEMGLVLEDVAVRHSAITRSAIKASRSFRTASSGSPEKIRPARGGNFTVSTFATIVGELNSPTFFGSMPTSAHDQWVTRPPRSTRIFPVSVGSLGLLQPKLTVHKQGIVVCHHSVPSSAVRRARTLPPSIRISDA